MQPIDFAEKWTRAAWDWWRNRDATQPNVYTLRARAVAHYGQKAHSLTELMAVAAVEAMNEWQAYSMSPGCANCDGRILPTQKDREVQQIAGGDAYVLVHADPRHCTPVPM